MRDVEIPEQGAFYIELINDNIEKEIRQSHLERLEGIGMIQATGGTIGDSKSYYLTAEGLQAITTEDLNHTLSTTNNKLGNTVNELEDLQKSQTRSSAVQTIFSFTIIAFTTFQIISTQLRNPIQDATLSTLSIAIIGLLLMTVALVFGRKSIVDSVQQIIRQ